MAHGVAPAAVKTFDTSDFDDDSPTREYYLKGLERKVDTLGTAIHEERTDRKRQTEAIVAGLRNVEDSTKATNESIAAAVDEIRKLTKLVLEERGERFALADRVSAVEQRPTRARKK